MAETPCYQRIPTNLNLQQFNQFVFPHLSTGRRGPASKLSLQLVAGFTPEDFGKITEVARSL